MESEVGLDRRTIEDAVRRLRARRLTLARLVRRAAASRPDGTGSSDATGMTGAGERTPALGGIAAVDHAGELARVDAALARLRDGTFGLCRDCGAFLGVGRLRSRPLAERCWACQARAERQAAGMQAARVMDGVAPGMDAPGHVNGNEEGARA